MRTFVAITLSAVLTTPAPAQPAPPKPGPEHKMLKKLEGTWDTLLKAGDNESKGTMTYKMELGGLWLVGSLKSGMGGQKFYGKSVETYDARKKKFVSVWFDSMGTTPLTMEGTLDTKTKTMTMIGNGVGMDGKPAKWKSVSKMPDDDTIEMKMYVGDGKDPMFTVTYKRKKK